MFCFLSGGYGLGGAQTIQIIVISYLYKNGEKCKLFDVKNGSVYNELKSLDINFEFIEIDKPYSKKDYSKYLTKDDLLIVFDTNLWGNLFYFGNSQCKILVWEIYYPWVKRFIKYRHIPYKPLVSYFEKIILNEIVSKNGFYFIDYMGKKEIENRINISISDSFYLPIPVIIPLIKNTITYNTEKITISYIGRSVDWKINPFIKIIKDSQKLTSKYKFEYTVVCDNIIKFKKYMSNKSIIHNNININYYENVSHKELNSILTNSNLHISMGTSALDGAKLGVPTILIDASFEDFPTNYQYRWIYETKQLNLGEIITSKTTNYSGCHNFREILDMLENNFDTISIKCKNYVIENYSVENIVNKILNYRKTAILDFTYINNLLITRYMRLIRLIKFK